MPASQPTPPEAPNDRTHLHIATFGHNDHGKTTLISAITRILAKFDRTNIYMSVEQLQEALLEQWQRPSLMYTEVTHSIDARQYVQIDYRSQRDSIKSLLAGSHAIDGAILVVSAVEGVTAQVREQVLLASKVGIANIVVFLNKIDLVEDEDLPTVVELEIRDLLTQHQFPGDTAPIIRGSALRALISLGDHSRQDPAAKPIWQLLDMLNDTLQPSTNAIDKPFLMPVEDVFSIKGRGIAVTGRVERGQINLGESVEIVGFGYKIRETVITRIDVYQKTLTKAQPGDNVGCFLSDIERDEVSRGQVLANSGTLKAHKMFRGLTYVLTKEEGGRHTPFFDGYRNSIYLRTTDITGTITLPTNVDKVLPGDFVELIIRLIQPMALEKGTRFAIRSGGRTLGIGICTEVLPLNEKA